MDFKSFARSQVRSSIRTGLKFASRQLRDPKNADLLYDLLGTKPPASKSDAPSEKPAPQKQPAHTSARASGDFQAARKAHRSRPKQRFPKQPDGGYPGDYTGPIKPMYAPDLDGDADPGEIVWGWVPFEEDHTQGKDRPVLIIGRENKWLLGLMLTSKDNIPGGVGEVRTSEHGSRYINIGSGDWDKQGRPSEIRLDRIIRIDARDIRREGAVMPMSMFSRVVDAVKGTEKK